MKNGMMKYVGAGLLAVTLVGCQSAEERESVQKGAAVGAAGGALLGLALGSLTGDAGKGAAAGAAMGAAGGAMYEYDEIREDRRNDKLSSAIGGANKGETADGAGMRHLDGFIGQWDVSIWALGPDGKRVTGTGKASGSLVAKDTLQLEITDMLVAGFDEVFTGGATLKYDDRSGFELQTRASGDAAPNNFVGEYVPSSNSYNFYAAGPDADSTRTGVVRSNVRVQMRLSGENLIISESFTMIDGEEVQFQSYRMTR